MGAKTSVRSLRNTVISPLDDYVRFLRRIERDVLNRGTERKPVDYAEGIRE